MRDTPIWPHAHARLDSEMAVRERGEVFLVGAGVFGKDLCVRLREKGAIGLDMGSALDVIAGKTTRGAKRRLLDLVATGMTSTEIACQLQRIYRIPIDNVALVERTADTLGGQIAAWRERPLGRSYLAVHAEILEVEVQNRPRNCHIVWGIDSNDYPEALGIWWQDGEQCATHQMHSELRRRGVNELPLSQLRSGRSPSVDPYSSVRKAVQLHGSFENEGAATAVVFLALLRAEAKWPCSDQGDATSARRPRRPLA